jgi:hypothetical protein
MTAVARAYRDFARREARGRSAAYEALAESVADDAALVAFVAALPRSKQQPQLLFAAARYLLGFPPGIGPLRDLVSQSPAELTRVILARGTQTNEPARCAILLPALAQLPEPLALIEVGASAGLTSLFDRYSYDYGGHHLAGSDPHAPTLRCRPSGLVPLPTRIPAITWRAGLDLSPLDVTSDDDARWLSCLVWPGEGDRAERLSAAIATARRDPPVVRRGDLRAGLPALAAQAPAGTTVVVYHSSVLYQVSPQDREEFAATVAGLGVSWLSSEAPGIVPGTAMPAVDDQMCVLARDGRPIARADSHGAWLSWLLRGHVPRRSELVAGFHQREAEEVLAAPMLWGRGQVVAGGHPDAPDPVAGGRLDKHPVAGGEQVVAQFRVLAELRHVPGDDQAEAALRPAFLVEPAHLPAQFLRLTRVRCQGDTPGRLRVAEQECLRRHHEVLRRRVRHAVHGEFGWPPLAQAALPNAAVRLRLMSPEEQVLRLTAPGNEVKQQGRAAHLGHRHGHNAMFPGAALSGVDPGLLGVYAAGWGGPLVVARPDLRDVPAVGLLELVAGAAAGPAVAAAGRAAFIERLGVLEVGLAGVPGAGREAALAVPDVHEVAQQTAGVMAG